MCEKARMSLKMRRWEKGKFLLLFSIKNRYPNFNSPDHTHVPDHLVFPVATHG